MKRLLLIALLAATLAGCVVVPARPVYYSRPALVVY
jgi:3-polyprenyl-4-hydroxybenzoate decarboxylase